MPTALQALIMTSQGKPAPTFGAFTITTQIKGNANFTISPPTSNSSGAWTFSSSDPTVLAVNATTGVATIGNIGSAVITATQAADATYAQGSVTATVAVTNATFAGVWAVSATLDTNRGTSGSFGSPTDMIIFAGYGAGATTNTSSYFNGTTWSALSALTWTASSWAIGAGKASSNGMAHQGGGGKNGSIWNGSSWTATVVSTNTHSSQGAGFGNSASSCAFAAGSSAAISYTDVFNGTAYSAGGNMNNGTLYGNAGCGSLLDGMSAGKYSATLAQVVERYNGTTWSVAPDAILFNLNPGLAGNPNNAVYFGGLNAASAVQIGSTTFNGTAWAATGNQPNSTTHRHPGMSGSVTSSLTAICAGGVSGSNGNTATTRFS
jgi:hypothetical protein